MRVLSFKHLCFGSLVESSRVAQRVFAFLLIPCCFTLDFRAPPLFPNIPFLWSWNAPTEKCIGELNKSLDMRLFSLIGSPRKGVTGQGITIFYTDRLGNYPHLDPTNTSVHGGIPQKGNLQQHLDKAKNDVVYYIPKDSIGLAVIDWQEWRPIWDRNWGPKEYYKNKSIELVQQQNPQLSVTEATKVAEEEFEKAAKSFMQETLKLGKSLRSKKLWGYYLFPDCYNHDYENPNFSGNCTNVQKQRNDALLWLWKESTALYPSIYLKSTLRSSRKAVLFVRNRVQEAIRLSKLPDPKYPLPVFVYTRLVFTDQTLEFLSQEDLVSTIGETAALGASGIVIWGALSLVRSKKYCLNLEDYLESTVTPYLINITLATKMCSQVLCQNKGVCTRKEPNSDDYLHLDPMNFVIETIRGRNYSVKGKPTLKDLQYFSEKFQCTCYANVNCKERLDMENVHAVKVCAFENVCIDACVEHKESSPSATESPHVPRKGLSGWLLVICIYIHSI